MSGNSQNQVTSTRNQSNVQYTFSELFLGDNKFDSKTYTNATGDAETLSLGTLLMKSGDTTVAVLDTAANIPNVVGIANVRQDLEVADSASATILMGTEGDLREDCIELPSGITLDTSPSGSNLTLRDRLLELGFHIESVVDNTKFDNA